MAGGAIVNTGGGKDYPGKLTLFVLLTCIVAATGGLIFGYDIGISGGVTSMDPFLKKFFPEVFRKKQEAKTNQYCKYENQLLQTFTSSLYLAALVASFFAATVTRVLGRKWSMLVGGLTFLVGAALNGAAQNVAMLIIGRILLGVGVGFANQWILRQPQGTDLCGYYVCEFLKLCSKRTNLEYEKTKNLKGKTLQTHHLKAMQETIAGFLNEQVLKPGAKFYFNPDEQWLPKN